MSDPPPPSRGRARARARPAALLPLVTTVAEENLPLMEPPTLETLHMDSHMYGVSRSSGGAKSGTSSGNEAEGGSSGGSAPIRGLPRGAQRSSERRPRPGSLRVDPEFIRTRPAGFDKKGSSGKALEIVSNYYEFRMNKGYKLGLYAVAVTVQPPSDEIDDKKIRALVKTRKDQLGSYLLSGSQLMTTHPIPEELLQPFQAALPILDGHEGVVPTYTVTISYLREVQDHEGFVIQFYNVIVRTVQGILNYAQVGRHYYDPKAAVQFNSWRLQLWPGFINSIRAQEAGLFLNIESCWKVLSTQNIYEKMLEIRAQDRDNFKENCSRAIVGTMVVTPYNPKAYKIVRIDFEANCSNTFETPKGRTSFTDYFWTKYKQQVRHPNQPMLVSEPSRREQRRGMIGDVYLVPELCFPAGLNDELRANFKLMRELASCLHMNPTNRVKTMQDFMNRIQNSPEVQTALEAWGVGFNRAPVEVAARQIPPERLLFHNDEPFPLDDNADWTLAFRSKRMYKPAILSQWAIIVTNRDAQGVNHLISTMQRVAGPIGYTISQPLAIVRTANPSASAFTNALNEAIVKAQGKLDMILIILPNPNADTYAAVKKFCSISHGIPSQCFLAKHFNNAKGLMSICTKLVIQMSAKQGGEPWGAFIPMKRIMVLGYDVHHGPVGTRGASVAAMTATFNESLGRCYSKIAKLESREEVATTVAKLFDECLRSYFRQNNVLPDRIMMYRDGVGEGQLADVYNNELEGIKDKITLRYQQKGTSPPKLSYIVVNKRINTRIFAKDRAPQCYINPLPGTVVDDVVTRPERYDFFLISPTARQGCVSPTYYNVLLDESGLDADKMQRFTFKLCHLYFNWAGTVAVPGPCQNAHKLAFLTGTALRGDANVKLAYQMHFL